MSDKPKFDWAVGLRVGQELCRLLEPYCHRIEIVGSVRRQKPLVGDVEILFAPRMSERKDDFFASKNYDCAAEKIESLVADCTLARRRNVNGSFVWGAQNKLAMHCQSRIPVDLFSTNAQNWFMSLVIRTGPKESNLRLIDNAAKRGYKLHAYGTFTDSEGNDVPCESEADVFRIAGVPYSEPMDRR